MAKEDQLIGRIGLNVARNGMEGKCEACTPVQPMTIFDAVLTVLAVELFSVMSQLRGSSNS